MNPKKINLGCGASLLDGYINVDWHSVLGADVTHDLNAFPYPFEESSVDEILASHVLEHLDRPFDVMRELNRILKPNGKLIVKVPHFSRGFTHAEHCHGFDVSFPKYFDPTFTMSGYTGVYFELEDMRLRWLALAHLMPYYGIKPLTIAILKVIDSVISAAANMSPLLCSRIWCYWVGGFEEISFVFRCKK